jgi:hypothetical protein
MMSTAKHIDRIGALAVALGVGLTTTVSAPTASASSTPCADTKVTCALIMGGTTAPTPNGAYIDAVRNQFIEPTHPGYIEYVPVTTPEELWPVTGIARVLGLALGPPELFGLAGPGWPDEPLWKLSGLFDLTARQSLEAGATDLEDAIAEHPNEHLVISGYSQGAGVANVVKKRLAEQYPAKTPAPDIDFVLIGDPNLPNGGLVSRFPGLYIPILDFPFNGPAATDTQFDTVEITKRYDGFTDFPLYPLNFIADLNAVLGIVYVHMYMFDVSLPADDPTESPAYQGKYGDTSYYLFANPDLPLFGPLRTLGVPEPVIDVFEPFFKVIVETGYDRSIKPWEPTPARLIPPLHPAKLATDLVDAIGEGIDNAGALVEPPALLKTPAAMTDTDTQGLVEKAELQTNESIGAVESVDNGRTTVSSPGHTNDSTPLTFGHARQTPLRDAVKNLSGGIKKIVADASDGIKKAMSVGKHNDVKRAREDAGNQPAASTGAG